MTLPSREQAWQAFLNAWVDEGRPVAEAPPAFDAWWRGEQVDAPVGTGEATGEVTGSPNMRRDGGRRRW